MSDIKNIQIGNSLYNIGSSVSGSGMRIGTSEEIHQDDSTIVVVRSNTILAIIPALNSKELITIGLPLEFLGESGKLGHTGLDFFIYNDKDTTYPDYPYKITVLGLGLKQHYYLQKPIEEISENDEVLTQTTFMNKSLFENSTTYPIKNASFSNQSTIGIGMINLQIVYLLKIDDNFITWINDEAIVFLINDITVGDIITNDDYSCRIFYVGSDYLEVEPINKYELIIYFIGIPNISNIPIHVIESNILELDFSNIPCIMTMSYYNGLISLRTFITNEGIL